MTLTHPHPHHHHPNRPHPPLLPIAQPRLNFRQLVRPGVEAVRQNWRPFVALQVVALGLVIAYYQVAAVAGVLNHLSEYRTAGGYAFAALAAVLAGAVLPEVAKLLTQRGWQLTASRARELAFLAVFFSFNGILVDAFYRLMAFIFGDGKDWPTILGKAGVDQFIFTPFIALPITAFAFGWRRNGYRLVRLMNEVRSTGPATWYLRRIVTLLLPCWCFWGPMVILIYSLPDALQIILWGGAMGAWSLVMVFIGNADEPTPEPVPPPS